MSDLVERLRDHALFNKQDRCLMFKEAADRIEALEAALEQAISSATIWSKRITALEAALRLCVIELRQVPSTEGDGKWRALKKATAALAPEQHKSVNVFDLLARYPEQDK
jgi:uncharacterized protein YdeI (YjbR/CyaY-like superfamily)